jgi:hypothetical protein
VIIEFPKNKIKYYCPRCVVPMKFGTKTVTKSNEKTNIAMCPTCLLHMTLDEFGRIASKKES